MNLNLDQIPSILRGRAGRIKANDKRKLRDPRTLRGDKSMRTIKSPYFS